mmetsp:Transcript_44739/g.121948  ORF Transcript_44739/g.121948 Transcript_44739/m.121948 type:complete len:480 (+) Transcript_44739:803-2242(+)
MLNWFCLFTPASGPCTSILKKIRMLLSSRHGIVSYACLTMTPLFASNTQQFNKKINRCDKPHMSDAIYNEDHKAADIAEKIRMNKKIMGDVEAWALFMEAENARQEAAGHGGQKRHTDTAEKEREAYQRTLLGDARPVTAVQMVAVYLAFADFVSDVIWACKVISDQEPGITALPGYAAALFLLCMMLYNSLCIREMQGEDWWKNTLDEDYLKRHPVAYLIFQYLMLTDMELVALLPWKPASGNANGFPPEAQEKGRFNTHVEDGVQFLLQIMYLMLLGEMDWATLPSMVLSAAAFIFRMYVSTDQSMLQNQESRQRRAQEEGGTELGIARTQNSGYVRAADQRPPRLRKVAPSPEVDLSVAAVEAPASKRTVAPLLKPRADTSVAAAAPAPKARPRAKQVVAAPLVIKDRREEARARHEAKLKKAQERKSKEAEDADASARAKASKQEEARARHEAKLKKSRERKRKVCDSRSHATLT